MEDCSCNCHGWLSKWKITEPKITESKPQFIITIDGKNTLEPKSIDELNQSFEILKYHKKNESSDNEKTSKILTHINRVVFDPIILHDVYTKNVTEIINWIQAQKKPTHLTITINYAKPPRTYNMKLNNAFIRNYSLIIRNEGFLFKKIEIEIDSFEIKEK